MAGTTGRSVMSIRGENADTPLMRSSPSQADGAGRITSPKPGRALQNVRVACGPLAIKPGLKGQDVRSTRTSDDALARDRAYLLGHRP